MKNFDENISLDQQESKDLLKTIKQYVNLYKALHFIDPSIAAEFKKKQEYFLTLKHSQNDHDKLSSNHNSGSCCNSKVINKIFIPKDKMNNIEKNLSDLYETFYYQSNIEELLTFLNIKFDNITASGLKDGLELDKETERQLVHKMMLEGIPFYISDKLKKKLLTFEESISEQPMLLAHPSSVKKDELLNFIDPSSISKLINEDFTVINNKIYPHLNEYELFTQLKYLYMEGNFEDSSLKFEGRRTDFILKYPYPYFKNSKHKTLNEFSHLVYYLPFELNKKFPNFQLQTNDYLQASYFRENSSYINETIDSSFDEGKDSGKKITIMFTLFPEDLELSKRKLSIKLKYQNKNEEEDNNNIIIEMTNPLSCLIFKSRKFSYEILSQKYPFFLLFYYIHGPIDKSNFSC